MCLRDFEQESSFAQWLQLGFASASATATECEELSHSPLGDTSSAGESRGGMNALLATTRAFVGVIGGLSSTELDGDSDVQDDCDEEPVRDPSTGKCTM